MRTDIALWALLGGIATSLASTNAKSASEAANEVGPQNASEAAALEEHLFSTDPVLRAAMVGAVIDQRSRLADAQVNRLINDPLPEIRQSIARYPFLSPSNVQRLIATQDNRAVAIFAQLNPAASSPEVIALLIDAHMESVDWVLASNRRMQLTAPQIRQLQDRATPALRITLAQRIGAQVSEMDQQLAVRTSSTHDVIRMIGSLDPVPTAIVDEVLNSGAPESRRYLSMQGRFKPSEGQVMRMMKDQDREVRIGILRRSDVDIAAETVAEGIFDADESLAFFYRNRKEFRPTAEQVESGLSSPRVVLRRSFAAIKDVPLTQLQIDRGLRDEDEAVRKVFLGKADISLTQTQWASCLADRSFFIREACVRRADFAMSEANFEMLLLDANPNVLTAALRSHADAAKHLPAYINTLLSRDACTCLIALAKRTDVALTSDQLEAGLSHRESSVRAAFERRSRRPKPSN